MPSLFPLQMQLPNVAASAATLPAPMPAPMPQPGWSQADTAALLAQIGQAAAAGSGSPGMVAFGNVAGNVTQGKLQKQFSQQLQQNPNAAPPTMLAPDRVQASYDMVDKALSMQKKAFDLARTPKQAELADRLAEMTMSDMLSQMKTREANTAIAGRNATVAERGATLAESSQGLSALKTMADIAATQADISLTPTKKKLMEAQAQHWLNAGNGSEQKPFAWNQSYARSQVAIAMATDEQAEAALVFSPGDVATYLYREFTPQQKLEYEQRVATMSTGVSQPMLQMPSPGGAATMPPGVPPTARQAPTGEWGWSNADGTISIFDPTTGKTEVVAP